MNPGKLIVPFRFYPVWLKSDVHVMITCSTTETKTDAQTESRGPPPQLPLRQPPPPIPSSALSQSDQSQYPPSPPSPRRPRSLVLLALCLTNLGITSMPTGNDHACLRFFWPMCPTYMVVENNYFFLIAFMRTHDAATAPLFPLIAQQRDDKSNLKVNLFGDVAYACMNV